MLLLAWVPAMADDNLHRQVCAQVVREMRKGLQMYADKDSAQNKYIGFLEQENKELCALLELADSDKSKLEKLNSICYEDMEKEKRFWRRRSLKVGLGSGSAGFVLGTVASFFFRY